MKLDNNKAGQDLSDRSQEPIPAKTACDGLLDHPESFPRAIYRDERIYFCTMACLRVFGQNPDAFMAGEIEHPAEEI